MTDQSRSNVISNLTSEALRNWPLPVPDPDGDKEQRGHIMIIGGSRQMPGAVILAASAALRAGAGKLVIATGASVAQLVALAIPESRVVGLPETAEGGITVASARALEGLAGKIDAVLIGPGMQDEPAICEFVEALLPRLSETKVVLDACAMGVVRNPEQAFGPSGRGGGPDRTGAADAADKRFIGRHDARVLLTPHAGEMAHLSGASKEDIEADRPAMAQIAARRWNAVVALKGPATIIAAPDGRRWSHEGGNIGLAISGSGDTLAGIIAGLAARGATLEQAAAWGVALHARAGERLAQRIGPLGYLARELAAEVPMLMHELRPR
jgi:hydroxyethylthiazole kinase-like uncharacterized protein yjeF